MLHFLRAITNPLAIVMLYIWLYSLWVQLVPGYPAWGPAGERRTGSLLAFICWLVLLVIAFLAWAFMVFSS